MTRFFSEAVSDATSTLGDWHPNAHHAMGTIAVNMASRTLSSLHYAVLSLRDPIGWGDNGTIEADCKAQKIRTKIGSPPLPPEGRLKTVLLFRCSGGCRGGSIATAVEKRNLHDAWPRPEQRVNVTTPELYGPPWLFYLIVAQGGDYG